MSTILLTGGTSGVGRAVANVLAGRGDRLLLLARSEERGAAALGDADGRVLLADLSDPAAIDALDVDEPIDAFAHIAGVLRLGRHAGAGGVDEVWATNVLGPARLLHRVGDRIVEGGRVTVISGQAHYRAPVRADSVGLSGGLTAARQSTTAKLLWMKELARRRTEWVVTSFCPGRVRTELHRGLPWMLQPIAKLVLATGCPPEDAAPHVVDLVDGKHPSGTFTVSGVPTQPAPHVEDAGLQRAVFDWVSGWAP